MKTFRVYHVDFVTPELVSISAVSHWMREGRMIDSGGDRKTVSRTVAVKGDALEAIREVLRAFPKADIFAVRFIAEEDNLAGEAAEIKQSGGMRTKEDVDQVEELRDGE